ncbi:hypothetical protein Hanom_Chr12g01157311 [Helianthus anomalus]
MTGGFSVTGSLSFFEAPPFLRVPALLPFLETDTSAVTASFFSLETDCFSVLFSFSVTFVSSLSSSCLSQESVFSFETSCSTTFCTSLHIPTKC